MVTYTDIVKKKLFLVEWLAMKNINNSDPQELHNALADIIGITTASPSKIQEIYKNYENY